MPVLSSAFELPRGRLLALDLGQARIGVAVCDEAGLARAATRAADFAAIQRIVTDQKVAGVLAGMPAADSGAEEEGRQARWTRRYGGRLAGYLSVPLAYWDETLSSADASALLTQIQSSAGIDAVAAALILGDFLQARRSALS
jgi:putative Holliday junction resolvase